MHRPGPLAALPCDTLVTWLSHAAPLCAKLTSTDAACRSACVGGSPKALGVVSKQ